MRSGQSARPGTSDEKSTLVKQAIADALQERGYTTLTPVQEAVTKPELEGSDLLVSAQTGSGKTLGFGLAIANSLLGEAEHFDRAGAPLALVIAPTRELALQVKRELGWLYAKAGAYVASCVGGMDVRTERRALERGAHIVVATPGRLRDHITRETIDLSQIRAVVLDEADEMLDLGFREDLEFILNEAPAERQTLLFSATVPRSIAELAKSYQKDAERIITRTEESQHADIDYHAMLVTDRDSENAVINTLRFYEAPNAIVFCNTRDMVNRLTTRLSNRGFKVVALSGELSQTERSHALQAMRDGRARVCVATDVAARGIDLPNLDLVVHAELPSSFETLLHRSGRTGRAGRKGDSALIVTPKSRRKAERLLNMAKIRAEWGSAPTADAVLAREEERMLADPVWTETTAEDEPGTVTKLVESFSAQQLAAAYLKLYRAQHSAPEEIVEFDEKPKPRPEFGPSVWFSVPGGRNANAEPRRLLPVLCEAGDLSRNAIGAIRIQQDLSYVQISESNVEGFLEALGPKMELEPGVVMTRLEEAPQISKAPPRSGGKPFKGKSGYPKSGKPEGKFGGKPGGKPSGRFEKRADGEAGGKPSGKFGGKPSGKSWDKPSGKPGGRPKAKFDSDGGPHKKKGPQPPVGKPNSKKNKARAKSAEAHRN